MKSRWKDFKVRANDVQMGDYVYYRGSYEQVYAIQYGVPHEGFVMLRLGEPGHSSNEDDVRHCFLADDSLTVARRSGDQPELEWVQLPTNLRPALIRMMESALHEVNNKMLEARRSGKPLSRQDQERRVEIGAAGLWIAAVCDRERLAEAIKELL